MQWTKYIYTDDIYSRNAVSLQAITRTNVDLLLIGTMGVIFDEILIKIQLFSFTKKHLKVSSARCQSYHLYRMTGFQQIVHSLNGRLSGTVESNNGVGYSSN